MLSSSMASCEQEFREAANFVRNPPDDASYRIDSKTRLRLYGLYKQATVGNCNRSKPAFFLFGAVRKWRAWSGFKDMEQDDAMKEYILLVEDLRTKAQQEAWRRT